MPINAGYEYIAAEKNYLNAKTPEERIMFLEELIRAAPKHKGSENLLKELKTRLKKFKEKAEKASKSGRGKKGIRKEGFQFALIGLPNSGKSLLLSKLTNARPLVATYQFSTKFPEIGTLHYEGVKAQIVDVPSIGSEFFDLNIANTADCIIIVVSNLSEIEIVGKSLVKARGKKIIAVNKSDLLNETERRKLEATIKSKKLNAVLISAETKNNLEALKEKMIESMSIVRVYTKEPGKLPAKDPVTLPINSTIKDVAEEIRKGFSNNIKEARVTGPSSKFPNQKVGLSHIVKDRDIVEFKTK